MTLQEICTALEALIDAEQEAFDVKSEQWQDSEAGSLATERLDDLQGALDTLDSLL